MIIASPLNASPPAPERLSKEARLCHTKQAWANFFRRYNATISSGKDPKLSEELFKLLRSDPQSRQYDSSIFSTLLQACLASANLELGKEICAFTRPLSAPDLSILAARLYLESGEPLLSRELALRTLRHNSISTAQSLQLQALLCGSYSDTGHNLKAQRMLTAFCHALSTSALSPKDTADLQTQAARLHCLQGQYREASQLFRQSAATFLQLADWERAACALFYTALCLQHCSQNPAVEAAPLIHECRLLAEQFQLQAALAHCQAYAGLDAYYQGNFAEAREHLRKALMELPATDQSFRRATLLSLLSFCYLAMGRSYLARKYGLQTLTLAAEDRSQRYQCRYKTIEAALAWEEGKPELSQHLLLETLTPANTQALQTLDEWAAYNRYRLQAASLGLSSKAPLKREINPQLKSHGFSYREHNFALGQAALTQQKYPEAADFFSQVGENASQQGCLYHYSLALLGQLQVSLAQRQLGPKFDHLLEDFQHSLRSQSETPLRAQLNLCQAAQAYLEGDFESCYRALKAVKKNTRNGFAETFATGCWLATIEGRSLRLAQPWQLPLIARYTRLYFSPSLQALDKDHYLVSEQYEVDLSRFPALAELLNFLLKQAEYDSGLSAMQVSVWKESVLARGWEQKIRNSISRLRALFPYTLAPLILQKEPVTLFATAIKIHPLKQVGLAREAELYRLLSSQAMTSQQLSLRLAVSKATTKRILQSLLQQEKISPVRHGRHIFYEAR